MDTTHRSEGCPTCGAYKHEPCTGARGQTRKTIHAGRIDYVREVKANKRITHVEIVYHGTSRAYAYRVPEGMEVGIGNLVRIPTTWSGGNTGTVVSLDTDYDGPCQSILSVILD